VIVGAIIIVVLALTSIIYYVKNNTSVPASVLMNSEKNPTLIQNSREVLGALAKHDFAKLQTLTSDSGLTLSMYPNLDLQKIHSIKSNIANLPKDKTIYLFGYTDGKGDPVNMTTSEFIDKWIYTKDYVNAPQIAVNSTLGGGNSLNSLKKDIGDRDFVAFHFPGFEAKYDGMDWTTIYLVFDHDNTGAYKLRAIAKDNWTI
jgi:hypothetical protein